MRQVNRRRSFRVRVPGGVVDLTGPEYGGTWQVINLSSRGVLIQGEEVLQLGTPCRLLLWLPDGAGINIQAQVRRCERLVHSIVRLALEFQELNASTAECIMGLVASELDRQQKHLVLVATSQESEGAQILAALERHGRRGVMVRTLLDAIQHLEREAHPVDAVIYGNKVGSVSGAEFARYLTRYYPTVRRLVLAEGPQPQAEAEAAHADAVLPSRWQLPDLEQALVY